MTLLVRLFGITGILLVAACDAQEDVTVQPLPPLHLPSPEARAGLPEVQGLWRFAGWEVPSEAWLGDTTVVPLGVVGITDQRMDSLGGYYGAGEARTPLFGEIRRDSIVSLAVPPAAGSGYLAGRVQSDTLWVRLTSLGGDRLWPAGARAAFVRGEVDAPFVRLPGGRVPVDTADTMDTTEITPSEAQPPVVAPSVERPEPRPEREQPDRAVRPAPEEERAPRPQEPAPPRSKPTPRAPAPDPRPAPQPDPEREAEPEPRKPKLLGVPATRPDTAASPPGPGVDLPPR